MTLTTAQPTKPQSNPIISITDKPNKPRLSGQWHTVNGKLLCRWIAV